LHFVIIAGLIPWGFADDAVMAAVLERHQLHRLFVSMYIVYGYQPHVGASADALLDFTAQEVSQCILYANYGNLATLHPPR
jgi:hypothetical protein